MPAQQSRGSRLEASPTEQIFMRLSVRRDVGCWQILLQKYFGLRRAQHCFVGDLQIGRKIQNAVRRGAKIALTTHSADFCSTIGQQRTLFESPSARRHSPRAASPSPRGSCRFCGHLGADSRREAVVKASPDASLCHRLRAAAPLALAADAAQSAHATDPIVPASSRPFTMPPSSPAYCCHTRCLAARTGWGRPHGLGRD